MKRLIDSYFWWRRDGHNYSVYQSIKRVIGCDIIPILKIPYYYFHMLFYDRKFKKSEKKLQKFLNKKR